MPEEAARTENIKKLIDLSEAATESLKRALTAEELDHSWFYGDISLGAAKSYMEEAHGILVKMDPCDKQKQEQKNSEEGTQ